MKLGMLGRYDVDGLTVAASVSGRLVDLFVVVPLE